MSAIKDLFLERYQDTLQQLGAQIASILRQQVPYTSQGNRPAKNPYATGRLYNSINWNVRADNTISITYNRYGVYTDFGTRANADAGAFGIDQFNLPRFAGYVPGTMGINPQYWTSLNGQTELISFIEDELSVAIEEAIETTSQRIGGA